MYFNRNVVGILVKQEITQNSSRRNVVGVGTVVKCGWDTSHLVATLQVSLGEIQMFSS